MWIWSYYEYWLRILGLLWKELNIKEKHIYILKDFDKKLNKKKLSNLLKGLGYEGLMLIGCKGLSRKHIDEDTQEKWLHYLFRQISKLELFCLLKIFSEQELHLPLKKLYLLDKLLAMIIVLSVLRLQWWCFKIIKYTKIVVHFYCDNCSFGKEPGTSLRVWKYLINRNIEIKPYELKWRTR